MKIKIDNDVKADLSIDSINMNINKQSVKYKVADMHFVNAKGYLGDDCDTQKRNFVYNCEKTFMYQFIPKKNTQIIIIDIQKDCTITRFDFYDFVSIKNFTVKVNEKKVNFLGNLVLKKEIVCLLNIL